MFVQLWMSTKLISIRPEQSLAEALTLFNNNSFRRLPVVTENKLLGILTPDDIAKALPAVTDPSGVENRETIARSTKVHTMMTRNPLTVSPDDTLEKAALLMRQHKIGGLPVVKDEKLVGLLSESDVLDALLEVLGTCEKCVRIELKIDKKPSSFYDLLAILEDYAMDIISIAVLKSYSPEHKLVTIRVAGPEVNDMIEDLWESKFQVNRILEQNYNAPG